MITKDEAKEKIKALVERYQKVVHEGRIDEFKEARTRAQFIHPLFAALGWDMENELVSDEVIPEDQVSHGRVDLAFRINHIPVLFVEAKSLKEGTDKPEFAKQAIDYSWHKGVTWAVLTDFKSVHIFNAEIPSKNIHANTFKKLDCLEFEARFEKLWLLSKDSFTKRLLDAEAEESFKKINRKPVDIKLFEDMLGWRQKLEMEFKKKNGGLSPDDVAEGVQRILDRLIFIRTASDRMIEPNTFTEWLNSGTVSWRNLNALFRKFDDGYNSKLFAVHACEKWNADDATLKSVLAEMKETPDGYRYDFNLIPSDVLGGMYEQYLSTVHQKKMASGDKSKQRKQGIYYTPKYIVDFIVNETVGKVLKGAKQKGIKNLKILDPACGSGSFLVSAFNSIIAAQKETLLTKQHALQENIFGVDIDSQAVEIAQLNLLLNLLYARDKLPNMRHNIIPANSLTIDTKERYDAIIGNPPYIKQYVNNAAFSGAESSPYYQGKMDIWTLFACRAIDQLKDGGYFSFIAPNHWLTDYGASKFRDKILSEGEIEKFVDFGDYKVFRDRTTGKDVGIQTMIFIFRKTKPRRSYPVICSEVLDKTMSEPEVAEWLASGFKNRTEHNRTVSFTAILTPKILIGKTISFNNAADSSLLDKIKAKSNFSLTEKEIAQGIVGDPDKAFIFDGISNFSSLEKGILFDYYTGTGRYSAGQKRGKIAYLDKNVKSLNGMSNFKIRLEQYAIDLKKRREVKKGRIEWFHLHWPRDERFFKKGPKIISAIRTAVPSCFYTEDYYYGSRAMNFIRTDRINMKYLTGLLNSKLCFYWLKSKGKQIGDLLQIDKGPLLGVPLLNPSGKEQDEIAAHVDSLSDKCLRLGKATPDTDGWNNLKIQIDREQEKIDKAIYSLYGLSMDDVKQIEPVKQP